jgi:ApbE superfamily uncharacterized protein (UPF0280 family)
MINPLDYRQRSYRDRIVKNDFKVFNVTVRETDLLISSETDVSAVALASVHKFRACLESYIAVHPEFTSSLVPLPRDEFAPLLVREMMVASNKANVGPMAAVAGAIAEFVGRDLRFFAHNVIIENGGDIYLNAAKDVTAGIFAGKSKLSGRVAIKIREEEMPLGLCTSSGTVGHSLSFGCADACCIKSGSTALADAAATAVGNLVHSKKDIRKALKEGMKIEGVDGIVIIVDDQLGVIGDMELVNE